MMINVGDSPLIGLTMAEAYSILPNVSRIIVKDINDFCLADTWQVCKIGARMDVPWADAKIISCYDFGSEIYISVDYKAKNPFSQKVLKVARLKGYLPAGVMRGYMSRKELLTAALEQMNCEDPQKVIQAIEDCYDITLMPNSIAPGRQERG